MLRLALFPFSVIFLAALIVGCDPAEEAEDDVAQVWFIHPTEGDTVTGPHLTVELGASGVEITSADIHEPGTGHHHLYVNRDLTPLGDTIPDGVPGILHLGQGQTEFEVRDLEPGENRIIAVIGDWGHVPLDPPAVDTVHFTVVEEEGEEGAEESNGG